MHPLALLLKGMGISPEKLLADALAMPQVKDALARIEALRLEFVALNKQIGEMRSELSALSAGVHANGGGGTVARSVDGPSERAGVNGVGGET